MNLHEQEGGLYSGLLIEERFIVPPSKQCTIAIVPTHAEGRSIRPRSNGVGEDDMVEIMERRQEVEWSPDMELEG